MAGFFGIDYNRPGPGVSKNAPQKKAFFLFWEIYFRKFFNLITANLLYVLVSLPLVTGGLAQAGLTFVTRNYCREKHVFLPSDFFDTIKKNWKQALVMGLVELAVGALMLFNLYFYWINLAAVKNVSLMLILMIALNLCIVILYCFMRYYIYLQIITFRMTLKQVIKNSFLLAVVGLKQNLLISGVLILLYAVAVLLFFINPLIGATVMLLAHAFVFPAFRSFLIQFTVFPVVKKAIIDPYYKAHPHEDIEARHNLNIETEEIPESKENIFEDREEVAPAVTEDGSDDYIPKQYSAEEMNRARRVGGRQSSDSDDDGVI
jgi:uncharacterized membrane protein YesL